MLTTPANMTWDTGDHSKATIDANGLLTGVAAGSITITALDTEHQKSGTLNLTVRSSFHILVADSNNSRIIRMDDISGSGWVSYGTAGNSSSGVGHFNYPGNVVEDNQGRIYVADSSNHRIVRMDDMSGTGWVSYGALGSGAGHFQWPTGIAVDATGHIYVADQYNSRIARIDDMSGSGWTTCNASTSGLGAFSLPAGVALDTHGRIYVADQGRSRIARMDDMNGTNIVAYGSPGSSSSGAGHFEWPCGIAVDAGGHIYVADTENQRIARIDDMSGSGWASYGSNGSGAGNFRWPGGIAVDAGGHIYVADTSNSRIVSMDNITGSGWTSYGSYGNGTGQFSYPSNISDD